MTDTINWGCRLVDIYVETTSRSHRFTGVYVANSDSYQKSWWCYCGVDGTTLSNALSSNNARLISLKAYDIGSGQFRFTAVTSSNTGADATAWGSGKYTGASYQPRFPGTVTPLLWMRFHPALKKA